MEIDYEKGDLILAANEYRVQAIAQGNNCFNTMKSGIAPQIAKAFPEAEWVDQQTKKGDPDKMGTITFVEYESTPYLVFNIYTQFNYGRDGKNYVSYDALEEGLYLVNEKIKEHNKSNPHNQIFKLGFPRIGCGLGGASWDKVSKIIENTIDAAKPTVYDLK